MSKLNQVFFNEYSKLDKLCRELYHKLPDDEIKGVTNYIDDMKDTPSHISRTVTDWDECLNALMHIRHIRNQLAHEPDAFEEIDCTQNDIDWVHYFHRSIMEHTDPISQAHKSINRQNTTPKKSVSNNTYYYEQVYKGAKSASNNIYLYERTYRGVKNEKKSGHSFIMFLLFAILVLGVVGALIFLIYGSILIF